MPPSPAPLSSASSSLKYLALAALCVQNSALILSMRYSRSVLHNSYLDSTIVIAMELVKFAASSALVLRDGHRPPHLLTLLRTSLPIALPSVLYVIQNTCQLAAVQNLDASTFSVLSQAKVLTTALCSVLVLGVRLSTRKWRALALLVLGCVLVQYTPSCGPVGGVADAAARAQAASVAFGLLMTLLMVTLSGVAGVLIERILKNQGAGMKSMSLWERNVQLSFWGVLFALLSALLRDGDALATNGFFHGWSAMAVVVVVCQSVGGLVTALVVKYTNTIIKGFAVGLSVVVTTLLSIPLFGQQLTLLFVCGAAAVLLSIFNFNEEDAPSAGGSAASGGGGVLPSVSDAKKSPALAPMQDEERGALLRDMEMSRVK